MFRGVPYLGFNCTTSHKTAWRPPAFSRLAALSEVLHAPRQGHRARQQGGGIQVGSIRIKYATCGNVCAALAAGTRLLLRTCCGLRPNSVQQNTGPRKRPHMCLHLSRATSLSTSMGATGAKSVFNACGGRSASRGPAGAPAPRRLPKIADFARKRGRNGPRNAEHTVRSSAGPVAQGLRERHAKPESPARACRTRRWGGHAASKSLRRKSPHSGVPESTSSKMPIVIRNGEQRASCSSCSASKASIAQNIVHPMGCAPPLTGCPHDVPS